MQPVPLEVLNYKSVIHGVLVLLGLVGYSTRSETRYSSQQAGALVDGQARRTFEA